jgi:hypothetical protein
MKNLAERKERFMRDELPIRLGGLAANLARVLSASRNSLNKDVVFSLFEESKFFIEWTAGETSLETAVELIEVQLQLAVWQLGLQSIWDDEDRRNEMAALSASWSNRIIERSGLLEK